MCDRNETAKIIIREERISRQDLIGHLDCSPRQVDRYIHQFLKKGMIKTEKVGKEVFYVLNQDHHEPALSLVRATKNEQLVLLMALNAARQQLMRTPLAKDVNRLLHAVNQQLEIEEAEIEDLQEDLAGFRLGDPPLEEMRPDVFFAVHKAKKENKTLTIAYQTGRSGLISRDRKVDPVLINLSSWTFVAWCHNRGKYLDFKFSRVLSVSSVMEQARLRPFNPQKHFQDRFSQLAGNTRYTLTLIAAPEVATYFKTKKYHASQNILAEHEDGSLTVSFVVINDDEVASFLRSWGPKVEVVAPLKMRERLLEEAQAVAGKYRKL